jgi:hypothetical protein
MNRLWKPIVLVFTVCVGGGALVFGITPEHFAFRSIIWANENKDGEQARKIATELRNTKRGVALAFNDLDIRGGRSRYEAMWMLQSTHVEGVDRMMNGILENEKEPAARKIAAARVLWIRTKEKRYLELWFSQVKDPGDSATRCGRFLLGPIFPKNFAQL